MSINLTPAPGRAGPLKWSVLAPFSVSVEGGWLAPFVDGSRHHLVGVPLPAGGTNWHTKRRGSTSLGEWRNHFQQADLGWRSDPDGLITVFPQVAVAAGALKRGRRIDRPLVAWCLNIGRLYRGPKRAMARFALRAADALVVHSRRECDHYSAHFGVPRERFSFVPLQRGHLDPTEPEERERPFVLAMGSARRDYATLIEAVRPLGLRTIIVAAPRCLDGLEVPDFVEVRSGLSHQECLSLAQQARLNVVPVDNEETASGQVTVIEAMWLGRPVIATRCLGTEDYIEPGVDGELTPPRDAGRLRQVIDDLWNDHARRERIGQAARARALAEFSDPMAGRELTRILDRVTHGGTPAG